MGPAEFWAPGAAPPWAQGRRRPGREAPAGFAAVMALGFHVLGNWRAAMALGSPASLVAGALLLVGPVALAFRRRAPIRVLIVAAVAGIAYATTGPPSWFVAVAPLIATFSAAKAGRGKQAFPAALLAWVAYVLVTWTFAGPLGVAPDARPGLRIALLTGAAAVLAVVLGEAARARDAYVAEQTKVHAERTRTRQEQQRRQAADERLRIARELHDVLGHHLSLINVQAGVGLHLMDNRPEQAREALSAIKTASSEALREVRAVLDTLRPDEEAAPRQPAHGLDRLADLTAGTGLTVTTSCTGVRRALPAEVDRAAYRIVQEALTNVRRHAGTAAASVAIDYGPRALRITVSDDGGVTAPGAAAAAGDPAAGVAAVEAPASADSAPGGSASGGSASGGPAPGGPAPGGPAPGGSAPGGSAVGDSAPGSGIAGMRERAETLGGTFSAGPVPGGGFRVEAVLPAARDEDGVDRDGGAGPAGGGEENA